MNRPDKYNAMNNTFWREIGEVFNQLGSDEDCRAIVLSANGKIFTSGLDFTDMNDLLSIVMSEDDIARKCQKMKAKIASYQESFSQLEKCPKPVVAAVHSACVGGGVDLICAADVRYATADAWFQVKEVDVGLAADVGTLQRLPRVIGNESLVRELAFTARKMFSSEALQCGLVSRVFDTKETMLAGALATAESIASKSPVAVQFTKQALVFSRDHSVQEGLEYQANVNMTMLQSEDVRIAAMALMSKGKEKPTFAKL